jgi:hypothetical protein
MSRFSVEGLNLIGLADVIFQVAETLNCNPQICETVRSETRKLQAIAYRIKQIFNPRDRKPLPFRLEDEQGGGGGLDCRIDLSGGTINVMPEGYGTREEAPGHAVPIVVEFYGGKLQVLVWSDITQGDPTHIINMEGAREDLRKED